jgi:hypothetical protein
MASFLAARLRLHGDRLPGPDRGGEPRSNFRIMPYLFAAAICADAANDRGFGAAHSASDFAAEDFARSTGDLPPALGSVRPA